METSPPDKMRRTKAKRVLILFIVFLSQFLNVRTPFTFLKLVKPVRHHCRECGNVGTPFTFVKLVKPVRHHCRECGNVRTPFTFVKVGFYLKNALFWNYCNSSSFYLNHNKLYITGKLLAHRL